MFFSKKLSFFSKKAIYFLETKVKSIRLAKSIRVFLERHLLNFSFERIFLMFDMILTVILMTIIQCSNTFLYKIKSTIKLSTFT